MKDPWLKTTAAAVMAFVFLLSAGYFILQMHHADNKPFWLDEKFSLKKTVQANSYLGLLAKAARTTEAAPAPLDFICTKALDDLKGHVGGFGLSDKIYYRLWANFCMSFCGFFLVVLFVRNILQSPDAALIKAYQIFLLAFLPLMYFYRPWAFHYGAEVRPYALWFALWLVAAGLCTLPKISPLALSAVLTLLAMTMVASVFQIIALGTAYLLARWYERGFKTAVIEAAKIVTIPLLAGLFYAYPATFVDRALEPWPQAWGRYFQWWTHEALIVPMMGALIALIVVSKEAPLRCVGPLAVLVLFLMGPLIFWMTVSRGYFYTERQYIYYDAHRAVFWLAMISVLPSYLGKIRETNKQTAAICLMFLLWLPFIFPKKTITYLQSTAWAAMGKYSG